jgi:antirestriction protein ArdC
MEKGKCMAKTQEQLFQEIADRIITLLNDGTIPWKKPWNPHNEAPVNFKTKRPYSGINTWMLMYAGFECRYWATFKQIKDMGGKVKKGAKSMPVVYWNVKKYVKEDEETGDEKVWNSFILKEYRVFNVEQTVVIEIPENDVMDIEFNEISSAEDIVVRMPFSPDIQFKKQDRAYYSPASDQVVMPMQEQFKSPESYYSTLFHELAHSTGHEKRLARKGITEANMFGSHGYSKEELVAEFASSFLCGVAGIENDATVNNSAAYIKSWVKALKNDPKMLITAAGQASKAANFILGIEDEKGAA